MSKSILRALVAVGAIAVVAPAFAADTTAPAPSSPSAGGIKKAKKDTTGAVDSSPSAGGIKKAKKGQGGE